MRRASVCCGDPGHAGGDELVFGGPKCPEGKGKLAHRRKAMGGIFFQAAKHNGSEALGHVRTNGAQGGRGGGHDLDAELGGALGAKGQVPTEQLVQHHPQGPDVRARIDIAGGTVSVLKQLRA